MHWWTKRMLFILSVLVLTACSSEIDRQNEENTAALDPVNEFINNLCYLVDLESPVIDSLVRQIHLAANNINGFTTKNPIDPGKIIFTAQHDSIFKPFIHTLKPHIDYNRNFQTYRVWKTNQLEFSLSPHPTENWVFMVRRV